MGSLNMGSLFSCWQCKYFYLRCACARIPPISLGLLSAPSELSFSMEGGSGSGSSRLGRELVVRTSEFRDLDRIRFDLLVRISYTCLHSCSQRTVLHPSLLHTCRPLSHSPLLPSASHYFAVAHSPSIHLPVRSAFGYTFKYFPRGNGQHCPFP